MKKVFYIILFISLGIICTGLNSETSFATQPQLNQMPHKFIHVTGKVYYYLNTQSIKDAVQIELKIKTGASKYKVVSVQLNEKKLINKAPGFFSNNFDYWTLSPSQTLEITVGVKDISKPLSKAKIIPLATLNNPNFIWMFKFPKPDTSINVSGERSLMFIWKWTNQPHFATLTIGKWPYQNNEELFEKSTSKSEILVPTSIFNKAKPKVPQKFYLTLVCKEDHDFTLSEYAANGSILGLRSTPFFLFTIF